MKKTLFLLLISFAGFSQQNFFNVPSSDITKAKHVFFQQQLNFISAGFQSSTTFCYGLGKNYEIGVNVIGVTVDYAASLADNAGTFIVLNGQKKWDVSPVFSTALGGQIGLSSLADGGAYAYSNGVYKLENTKLVGGIYYSSDAYFGPESRGFNASGTLDKFGFQAGPILFLKMWYSPPATKCPQWAANRKMRWCLKSPISRFNVAQESPLVS